MEPAMGIDQMTLALYNAAVEGKPQDYYKAPVTAVEDDGLQVMPNGNTVLHVAALHYRQHFVEKILEGKHHTASPSLLFSQNKKNQTALHCAAEFGYANVVSILIQKSKDIESGNEATRRMIQMTDNVSDTALHKAVRNGHLDVVKLLAGEDTEFVYPVNDAGETPIYIAAKSQFGDCLEKLLQICKHPTYGGPLGQNALHASTLLGSTECTKLLLEKEISLCEMTDDSGWTPLHYAIKNHSSRIVRMILDKKKSAAYIYAGKSDEWTTVFHIAAMLGDVTTMKYISNSCPDSWMMVNSKCQNILHQAVLGHRLNVIKYVLKHPQANNLNEGKDEDGNTPFDLVSVSSCDPLKRVAMQCLMRKYYLIFNKQHQTPFAMASLRNIKWPAFYINFLGLKLGGGGQGDLTEKPKDDAREKDDINRMLQVSEGNKIAATLLLTVTFAAGFTVPGGFDSNSGKTQGMPILAQNTAFEIFVLTNAFAFFFSISSLWIHNSMVEEASSSAPNYIVIKELYDYSAGMIYYATIFAIVAFCSGMYAILATLHALSYTVVALCGFCFFLINVLRTRAQIRSQQQKIKIKTEKETS